VAAGASIRLIFAEVKKQLKPSSITVAGSKLVADLQRAEIWPIVKLASSEL